MVSYFYRVSAILSELIVACCLTLKSTFVLIGVDGVFENNFALRGNGSGVVEAERFMTSILELSSS